MKRNIVAMFITAIFACALQADVYAVVNGEKLTDADIKPMLKMFADAKSLNDLNQHEKEMLLDQGIEKILIVQDAKKAKIENDKKFQEIVEDFKKRLLIEFWMKKQLDTITVSEEDAKTYFEKHKADYPKDTKLQDIMDEIKEKVKMDKFQRLVDEKLSNMKKAAKIEYR